MEYEEIQSNEVEALKAIYAADFTELKGQSVWNKRPSPKFVIRLRPSTEYEDSAIVVWLQTTMTETYPKTLPQIEVSKTASLSGRQIETLKQIISETIRALKGSEMVFEVTSNVQTQIDEWARFVAEAAPNLEEDRRRRLRLEETKQKEHQDQLQKEREAAAHRAEQKYDSLVIEALRNSHSETAKPDADPNSWLAVPESTLGVTTFARPVTIALGSQRAVFRQVMAGVAVPMGFFGTTYLSKALLPKAGQGQASSSQASSQSSNSQSSSQSSTSRNYNQVAPSPGAGPKVDVAVLMSQIGLSSPYYRTADGARELHDLNVELEMVHQLHLPGILHLSEFAIERFRGQENEWVITIVIPYVHLMTMDDMLNSTDTVNFKSAQVWSFQVLETLEELHKAGLRHSMICPSMLLINVDQDTGERSVVLRHPHYFYTLMRMNEQHPFEESHPSYDWLESVKQWVPPEGRGTTAAKPSRKWDIWQFGALLTYMLAGKRALYDFRGDPESYVRSMLRVWPPELTSFLLATLAADPAKRPSVLELRTDQFFRTDLDVPAESLVIARSANVAFPKPSPVADLSPRTLDAQPAPLSRRRLSGSEELASRYKQDFDEGIVLGRGGFGQVVKARNKLDGRIYAVKKVKATTKTLSHILQEVVLLSRLNHQYVVRYYTVWLEDESDQTETKANGSSTTTTTTTTTTAASRSEPAPNPLVSHSLSQGLAAPPQPLSQTGILDSLPSSSLSQFSPNQSISELDLPSVSQDFMSDSGFVEFGFSESGEGGEGGEAQDSEGSERHETNRQQTPLSAAREVENPIASPNIVARLARATSKTLYIQMEYCENHTLGDLVKQGLYKESHEYWRLLREILEALAYIHSEGVIHRDLKPKNIFIDQARNIKIGDFGLARSVGKQLRDDPVGGRAAAADDEDLTTDVGTSLYAAVEVMRSDKRGYNEKVDIFSLGIIFFEMIWGFGTEMERIQSIRNARKPQIELPAGLVNDKDKHTQVELIRSMLDHNPDNRPSASGMLQSGIIPVEDREMTIREALSNIRDPRAVQQLTNELFARPRVSAQEVLYDRVNTSVSFNQRQQLRLSPATEYLVMSHVLDTVRAVFRTHGAVDNTALRPRLFPKSRMYKSPTIVELLDHQGTVLQLPHDLTLPHARRLAEVVPDYAKAFAIDSVFRNRLQSPNLHPLRHTEVDFDIISVDTSEDTIVYNDAEAMAVMYDAANTVLNPLRGSNEDLIVVVSHQNIISATLSQCGLVPLQYHAAISLLVAGAQRELGTPLPRTNVMSTASLDMLSSFGFRETLAQAESRMSKLMPLSDRVKRGINHLRQVTDVFRQLCATQTAPPPVYFCPLINTATAEFYIGGIVFQLIDVRGLGLATSRKFGSGSVLAVGGRYDSLITSFRNSVLDGHTPLANAVGFGMSANKLEALVMKHGLMASTTAAAPGAPPRCQVLVSSRDVESVKKYGADVLKLLWACGVNADAVRESLATDGILSLAQREGVPLVVVIKQGHGLHSTGKAFKPLRVKRLDGSDVDLNLGELVPFIKAELGLARTEGEPQVNDGEPAPDIELGDQRVIVLNESGKLKGGRKNKWQLEERGSEARAQLLAELAAAPIISLDLRDDVLEAICTVSPHAAEDWKRRVVGLSPNQKAYIMTVQAKVSNEASRSPHMLLYSSKTENIFVYNY